MYLKDTRGYTNILSLFYGWKRSTSNMESSFCKCAIAPKYLLQFVYLYGPTTNDFACRKHNGNNVKILHAENTMEIM